MIKRMPHWLLLSLLLLTSTAHAMIDLYVGPLARYHVGAWKHDLNRATTEFQTLQVERESPEETLEKMKAWQIKLHAELEANNVHLAAWEETLEGQYFKERLSNPYELFAWLETKTGHYGQFPNLNAGLWLPTDVNFTISPHQMAFGWEETLSIGSSLGVQKEIELISKKMWGLSGPRLVEWAETVVPIIQSDATPEVIKQIKKSTKKQVEVFPDAKEQELSIRFDLARYYKLATLSLKHHLPMVLDY